MKGGPFAITKIPLRRIRLVEQTEQKFRRFESVLKKKIRMTVIVGLFH